MSSSTLSRFAVVPAIGLLLGALPSSGQPERREEESSGALSARLACARVPLDAPGDPKVESARADAAVLWVELGRDLLVCASGTGPLDDLFPPGQRVRTFASLETDRLRWLRGGRLAETHRDGITLLAAGGRHAIVHLSDATWEPPTHHGHSHVDVLPVPWNISMVRQALPRVARGSGGGLPAQAAGGIDGSRWFRDVEILAAFNRYAPGPGIAAATAVVEDLFEAIEGLDVARESFSYWSGGSVDAENVVATWDRGPASDVIVVGGHYDSTSQNTSSAAPGAEDNATGCAGVIELARVLTSLPPPSATVIFVCYSGEEQGLHGSADQVDRLLGDGRAARLRLMLNMDMIGYTADADLDVLLETNSTWDDELHPLFADAAEQHTSLRVELSSFAFGSDHVPFLQAGLPALLTIQNDWDQYPDYHRTTDVPANVSLDMGVEILRMNAAVLAEVAGSGTVVFADGFESGDVLEWSFASP